MDGGSLWMAGGFHMSVKTGYGLELVLSRLSLIITHRNLLVFSWRRTTSTGRRILILLRIEDSYARQLYIQLASKKWENIRIHRM